MGDAGIEEKGAEAGVSSTGGDVGRRTAGTRGRLRGGVGVGTRRKPGSTHTYSGSDPRLVVKGNTRSKSLFPIVPHPDNLSYHGASRWVPSGRFNTGLPPGGAISGPADATYTLSLS